MKNLFTLLLVFVLALPTFAQDKDTRSEKDAKAEKVETNPHDLKTIFGGKRVRHGGFAGFTANYAQMMDDEQGLILGFQAAWVMNHRFAMGFQGHGLASTVSYVGLDANNPDDRHRVEMGYGGIHLEPIIGPKFPIHLSFPVLLGMGYMGYYESRGNTIDRFDTYYGDLLDDDIFFIAEPGVYAELSLFKHLRMGVGVKYRYLEDLDLVSTQADSFNGFSGGITLKIGSF